ncbi:MAG TPA: hypothetical protein VMT11_01865 [Myxococcaceae bacterium]|nr:hypothetical protein [Myxococcaceae bacterium]
MSGSCSAISLVTRADAPGQPERFAADSTASLLGFVAAGLGFSVVPALHPDGPRRAGVRAIRLQRSLPAPGRGFPPARELPA